jgi:phenylacetate-CoA ligase
MNITKFCGSVGPRIADVFKKTHMVRSFFDIMKSQWFSPEQLEAMQIAKLRDLLIHAKRNVPYYKFIFEQNGICPEDFNSFEKLRKLPILTKDVIRANANDIIARNAHLFSPRSGATSGSTGEPLRFLRDSSAHSIGWASNWRAFSVTGFSLGEKIVVISGGSLMSAIKTLKQRIYYVLMGMKQIYANHLSDQEFDRYSKLLRNSKKRNYMFCYPSAGFLFARYLLRKKITDITFRAVFTTSEVLLPGHRQSMKEAFNCPVYDTYGNNESTLYAFECDCHEGLHYGMENAYMEILDDHYQPVAEGETGHIIATSLSNFAMPFIRYDTGDIGHIVTQKCSCGRGLKRIGKIVGRSRDFVVTASGDMIHGAFFNKLLYSIPWIVCCHILQDKVDHITISIRPEGEPVEGDLERMKRLIMEEFSKKIDVEFVINDQLHLTNTGKLKVVESLVANNLG